jgi:hypothetical protein
MARGAVAERHGKLLEVGTTTLTLAPGQFFFKTMSDANLRVFMVVSTSPRASATRIHGRCHRRPACSHRR